MCDGNRLRLPVIPSRLGRAERVRAFRFGLKKECSEHLLARQFLAAALTETPEHLSNEFRALPFEHFAPVRRQLLKLAGIVNRKREQAGLEPICTDSLVVSWRSERR